MGEGFNLGKLISNLGSLDIGVFDVIDIILVTVLLYLVYVFIRDRRAGKVAAGIFVIFIVYVISSLLNLGTLKFIIENITQLGLISLVIVFQPELRSALEKVGGEPLKGLKNISDTDKSKQGMSLVIEEVADACEIMSSEKTGALIVFENTTNLDVVVKGGTVINSDATSELIRNIFYKGAPLHDGAMIIREGKLYKAGCLLPLSANDKMSKSLGTRHHAGMGISEESDAVAIIVSEETGHISVARSGKLKIDLSKAALLSELNAIYDVAPKRTPKKKKVNKDA
ncbi:MAG: diadenylate cyclase CdaA [Firmicutes bacterium]|nr:diadenylate cyclase CdaA [Candidatus Colimorpha enterica]